jgi:hypothetical protein
MRYDVFGQTRMVEALDIFLQPRCFSLPPAPEHFAVDQVQDRFGIGPK